MEHEQGGAPLYMHLVKVVAGAPGKEVIRDGVLRLSYEELLARIDELAASLHEAGVTRREPVAVILENGVGFVAAVFAVWKLGAVVVPLNPLARDPEVLASILDVNAASIITGANRSGIASTLNAVGAAIRHLWTHSSSQTGFTHIAQADSRAPQLDAVAYADGGGLPALTQYSTGSTGKPKRVTRTQDRLLREMLAILDVFDMSESDRVLGAVAFCHSHGFKNAMLLSVLAGATLHTCERFFPRDIANLIERESITVFPGVPFMFQQLTKVEPRRDFSSLRVLFSGTAPLESPTAAAFADRYAKQIRRVYGTSETGLVTVERTPGIRDGTNCVGQPVPGVAVQVVDDAGEPVAIGEEGHVKITSPFAATDYDGACRKSASYFEGASYFPGDVGVISPEGNLILVGRQPGFINVGGEKVDPAEIEAALRELVGVSEVAVVGVPDALSGEAVKAIVVTSTPLTADDVRAHLASRLAAFKRPRIVEFRKELPRSPLGKVLRANLVTEDATGK